MTTLFRTLFCTLLIGLLGFSYAPSVSSSTLPEIKPPTIPGGKKTISLPATVDDLDVGGGGRYIALHMKSLRKIAIFDTNELKIIGYVTGAGDDTKFAAGATKLIAVSGDKGVVARWDLATAKRELAQTIELGGQVSQVLLGSSSDGPAIVGDGSGRNGQGKVVDMKTLKSIPFEADSMRRGFSPRGNFRISANGQVIGVWESGVSPSGLQSYINLDTKWKGHYEHDSVGYIIPSPDGKLLYTASGIFTSQLRRVGKQTQNIFAIPAQHGPFYITTTRSGDRNNTKETVSLHLEGDSRPIATIPNLVSASKDEDKWSRMAMTLDKRLILIPNANLIIQLDPTNQKIHAVHFDIDAALKNSSIDYLIVTSRPPLAIKAGEKMSYQIDVKSKAEGLVYTLDAAPKGMQLSRTGLLTWTTTRQSPAQANVIISVADKSGQQTYHTFDLNVDGGSLNAATDTAPVANGSAIKELTTTEAKLAGDTQAIKMPGTISNVTVGGSGRFIFLHLRDLKKIAVFDVSKAAITGYIPATDDDTQFVAGATRALVFSVSQGVVARYRLDNLKRDLTTTIPFTGKINFVGMGSGSEGPVLLRTSDGTSALDRCTFHLLDINTMKPIDAQWDNNRQPHASFRDYNRIYASTDGSTFAVSGAGVFRVDGTSIKMVGGRSNRSQAWPSADGKYFFSNGQLLNEEMSQIGDGSTRFGVAVPSIAGRYFLSMSKAATSSSRNAVDTQSAKLYMFGDSRPLVTIPDLEVSHANGSNYRQQIGWEQRILFVPEAKVIATIPRTNDRIILRKFDIDKALEASGVDYLVVDSLAPSEANLGKTYTYEIKVKSKRGGVKYTLDAAPAGMTVSSRGIVTWRVPRSQEEQTHKIIATISDASGQSVFHTFTVEIPEIVKRKQEAQAKQAALENQQRLEAQRVAEENRRKMLEHRRKQAEEARDLTRDAATEDGEDASENPDGDRDRNINFPIRAWKGNDGKFNVTAKFVRIENRKQVILEMDSGIEIRINLSKLSDEDIYEAVKSDLRR